MSKPIVRPEWFEAYCYVCETRRTDVAKLPAMGCGCEAELVICRDCLERSFTIAATGTKPRDV